MRNPNTHNVQPSKTWEARKEEKKKSICNPAGEAAEGPARSGGVTEQPPLPGEACAVLPFCCTAAQLLTLSQD